MRTWAGTVVVTEVPAFVRSLHEGWMLRKGVREKVQLARVRYEEGKHDNTMLVAELRDGSELVFDITSPPIQRGVRRRTPR